jgi:hypothetical protein
MKQPKALADLEAMQPRERDAWFAERFGWQDIWPDKSRKEIKFYGVKPRLGWRHTSCIPKFTGGVAPYYGITAIRNSMVELGYSFTVSYRKRKDGRNYRVDFIGAANAKIPLPPCGVVEYAYFADNEIEATWKAAALALLSHLSQTQQADK